MTNDELRELLLAYEELSDEERARADELLAARPELREVLERLRAAERAEPVGVLRDDAGDELRGDATASLQAARSRAALAAKLGLEVSREGHATAKEPSVGWSLVREIFRAHGRPVAAIAAVAVLVVAITVRDRVRGPFDRLELTVPSGERGGAGETVDDGVWHTGEAFVLRIVLNEPAHPVVVHVDGSGAVQPLYPESPSGAVPLAAPGDETIVPDPRSGETWRLEGEPGTETFLVVAGRSSDPGIEEILEEANRTPGDDRRSRVKRLVEQLERRVGPTRRIDVEHVP